MASASFAATGASVSTKLPPASISGNNPDEAFSEKSGDIIHTRGGQMIAMRSWSQVRTWTIIIPDMSEAQMLSLRVFWRDRAFELWPAGVSSPSYDVVWLGEFNAEFVGPGKFSIEIPLEEVI